VKTLLIHAGTHKTASTYIQSRLLSNKKNLEINGVRLLDIREKRGEKKLPSIICSRDFDELHSYLNRDCEQCEVLLYSAEQFTQLLVRGKKRLEWFLSALESMEFRLRVAIFVRDQPDYINSMYIQKAKKFIHSMDVSEYIYECLHYEKSWFNYNYMFSRLIDDPRIDVDFLPYGRKFGDPFERLMALPGWFAGFRSEWLPSVNSDPNDQPGAKGVYLALSISKQLERLGVDLCKLKGKGSYVRKYLLPLGWGSDRYFGLQEDDVKLIRRFYKKSNKKFCEKVWPGQSWRSVFGGQEKRHCNVLIESDLSDAERDEMRFLAEKIIDDLREINPNSFSGVVNNCIE